MGRRVNYEIEKAIDYAIEYLSIAFKNSGHNEKPVLIHSIRVGLTLFNHGYSKDIVLAGILHDVLEDTEVSYEQLEEFGIYIAQLVFAATINLRIQSKTERNRDVFYRCKALGRDALLVKCADISDNIDAFTPSKEYKELVKVLLEKYHDFIAIAEDELLEEGIFKVLKKKVFAVDSMMKSFEDV